MRLQLMIAIDIFSRGDADNFNNQFVILYSIHDPVLADADSVMIFEPTQFLNPERAWIRFQTVNTLRNFITIWFRDFQ